MAIPQTNYYKDPGATGGSNTGLTPADAWWQDQQAGEWLPDINPPYPDGDVFIWYRRGVTIVESFVNYFNNRPAHCREIHACWPLPGDPLYNYRPSAGIAAGWDADPATRPILDEGFMQQPSGTSIHGLHMKGCSGTWMVYASQGPSFFWGCTFEPDPTQNFRNNYNYGIYGANSYANLVDAIIFMDCTFHALDTQLTPTSPGENMFGMRDMGHASLQFVRCTFEKWHVNNTAAQQNNYQGGLLYDLDRTNNKEYKDITFIACTFPDVIGNLWSNVGWIDSPSSDSGKLTRMNIRFIGCDMGNGQLKLPADNESPNWTYPWLTEWWSGQVDADFCPGQRWAGIAAERYECVNDGLFTGKRFALDTSVFTLTDDSTITTPGTSDALVLTPKQTLIKGLQPSPRRGYNSQKFWHPIQVWPSEGDFRTWFCEATAGLAHTVKINAMCRGWISLPTKEDFYFVTYNVLNTGVNANAKIKVSSEAFAANDTWTEFTISLEACTFDTYVPVFFVIKNWESGADIVIDTTIETT